MLVALEAPTEALEEGLAMAKKAVSTGALRSTRASTLVAPPHETTKNHLEASGALFDDDAVGEPFRLATLFIPAID